jgi:hypothetical protein
METSTEKEVDAVRRYPSQLGVNGTRACNGQALQVKKKETSKSDLPQRDIKRRAKKPSAQERKCLTQRNRGAEVVEKAGQSAAFFFLTLWHSLCL